MATLTLTYFDINGGRAEPIRLALSMAGIAFEDYRIAFSEFPEVRKRTPLGQVPTMAIDGQQITQSNALCRYFGKQAGLYPTDDFQALLCDEVMDAIEDVSHKIVATFGLTGEALQTAREQLVAGPFTTYLGWLDERLVNQGGCYFADNRLTVADLKVYVFTRWLSSGQLDHVPQLLVKNIAPAVAAHSDRVHEEPKIVSYYQSRR